MLKEKITKEGTINEFVCDWFCGFNLNHIVFLEELKAHKQGLYGMDWYITVGQNETKLYLKPNETYKVDI
ncbi:hypothetical protein COE25_18725 [Bacillus sp. AFS031507]|nr:hypothetical protein COE25_18725 [Bacillus sp. AFS031507]